MSLVAAGIGSGEGVLLVLSGAGRDVTPVFRKADDVTLGIKTGMATATLLYLLCGECYWLITAVHRDDCNGPALYTCISVNSSRMVAFPLSSLKIALLIEYAG